MCPTTPHLVSHALSAWVVTTWTPAAHLAKRPADRVAVLSYPEVPIWQCPPRAILSLSKDLAPQLPTSEVAVPHSCHPELVEGPRSLRPRSEFPPTLTCHSDRAGEESRYLRLEMTRGIERQGKPGWARRADPPASPHLQPLSRCAGEGSRPVAQRKKSGVATPMPARPYREEGPSPAHRERGWGEGQGCAVSLFPAYLLLPAAHWERGWRDCHIQINHLSRDVRVRAQ